MLTLKLKTFALGTLEVSLIQLGTVKGNEQKIAKAAKRESKARQGISSGFKIFFGEVRPMEEERPG